jgi:hypothetical protein
MLDPMQKMGLLIRESQSTGAPVQALLLPGGQDVLPTIAPMLAYNNINTQQIKLLGTGGWDYPNIGQEPALDGAWFAAPDPAGWRDFSARYAKTYGAGPARIASLGYDAVSLAVSLSGGPQGQRYTPENLTRASGFAGADGLFRLRADGTSERGLAVLEVKRFGPQVLDPAPSGFATAEF